MLVNGYEVEEAPNGAWWVRRPRGCQAWRFATRHEALRFAQQLHRPAAPPAPPAPPAHPRSSLPLRGAGEQDRRRRA